MRSLRYPIMFTGNIDAHLAVASLEVPDADGAISMPSCYMRPSRACSHLCYLPCCLSLRDLRRHQKLCLQSARLTDWLNMHLHTPSRLLDAEIVSIKHVEFI